MFWLSPIIKMLLKRICKRSCVFPSGEQTGTDPDRSGWRRGREKQRLSQVHWDTAGTLYCHTSDGWWTRDLFPRRQERDSACVCNALWPMIHGENVLTLVKSRWRQTAVSRTPGLFLLSVQSAAPPKSLKLTHQQGWQLGALRSLSGCRDRSSTFGLSNTGWFTD